jgi:predicted signal transduction protein with EAL and GGDEF domain
MLDSEVFRLLDLKDDMVSIGKVIKYLKSSKNFYEEVFKRLEEIQKDKKIPLTEIDMRVFKLINEYFGKEVFFNLEELKVYRDTTNYKDTEGRVDFEDAKVLLPPMRVGSDTKRGLVIEGL